MILLTVLVLAVAAPARAATVEAHHVERGGESGGTDVLLDLTAAPGERNRIRVDTGGDEVVFHDAGAPLTPADTGCSADGPHTVRCPLGARGSFTVVTIRAGDRRDEVTASPPAGFRGVAVEALGEGGSDRLVLGTGGRLIGGPGDDVLEGSPESDDLTGGAGDDRLAGGGGDDALIGDGVRARGDDTIDGGHDRDVVIYGERRSLVTVDLADPGPDGAPGEADLLTGIEDVTGGYGQDRLAGDDGPNRLRACTESTCPRAREVLIGRGGDDSLLGGGGPDRLDGGDGGDALSGDSGDDVLSGGGDGDVAVPGAGEDRVEAGVGDDDVRDDDEDADRHDLGPGDDRLLGGAAGGEGGVDEVACGAGTDRVLTPTRSDRLATDCERIVSRVVHLRLRPARRGIRLALAARTRCRATVALPGRSEIRLRRSPVTLRTGRRSLALTVRLTECRRPRAVAFSVRVR